MGSEHHPGPAGEAPPDPGTPSAAPAVAEPLRPFGILSTFGWLAAALAAAMFAATLVVCIYVIVFEVAYEETAIDSVSDERILALMGTALAIATMPFFGVIVAACRRAGWRAGEYLGLAHPKGPYLLAALAAFFLQIGISSIAAQFGPLLTDAPLITTALAVSSLFVAAVIFAPIVEELIFRGFLYRGLAASRLGVPGAIVVTSVLWAAAHPDRTWLGYIELLSAGMALGWLRWQSDATTPGISVHALNNILAIALILGWGPR